MMVGKIVIVDIQRTSRPLLILECVGIPTSAQRHDWKEIPNDTFMLIHYLILVTWVSKISNIKEHSQYRPTSPELRPPHPTTRVSLLPRRRLRSCRLRKTSSRALCARRILFSNHSRWEFFNQFGEFSSLAKFVGGSLEVASPFGSAARYVHTCRVHSLYRVVHK